MVAKAAAKKAPVKKAAPRQVGISKVDERVSELERKVEVLTWLHAEISYAIRRAAAVQMAEKLQPQIQDALLQRLMSGQNGAPLI